MSATVAVVRLNLNARARVTLTRDGLDRLRRHYEDLGCDPPRIVDGVLEDQLWGLAHVFGPDLFNGSTRMPFARNRVEILDPGRDSYLVELPESA